MEVAPLPPDHPWYFLNRYGVPNVKWCEATVNSWIAEPANTWSNLAFVAVGIALLVLANGGGRSADKTLYLRRFGWTTVVLGFLSGIYHASSTFVLQIGDFLAMFMVFGLALFLNFRRMGLVEEHRFGVYYWPGVLIATAAVPIVYHWGFPIQAMVGILILALVVQEAILFLRKQGSNYPILLAAMGFGLVAAAASAVDLTRALCDPENHLLQGHAVWHVLNAAAIYCYARFFAGLKK